MLPLCTICGARTLSLNDKQFTYQSDGSSLLWGIDTFSSLKTSFTYLRPLQRSFSLANPIYNERCPDILANNPVLFFPLAEPCKWLVLLPLRWFCGTFLYVATAVHSRGNQWARRAGELRCTLMPLCARTSSRLKNWDWNLVCFKDKFCCWHLWSYLKLGCFSVCYSVAPSAVLSLKAFGVV